MICPLDSLGQEEHNPFDEELHGNLLPSTQPEAPEVASHNFEAEEGADSAERVTPATEEAADVQAEETEETLQASSAAKPAMEELKPVQETEVDESEARLLEGSLGESLGGSLEGSLEGSLGNVGRFPLEEEKEASELQALEIQREALETRLDTPITALDAEAQGGAQGAAQGAAQGGAQGEQGELCSEGETERGAWGRRVQSAESFLPM